MLPHAGSSRLTPPRCWHAVHALTCGPFKHTSVKDLTHSKAPACFSHLEGARYCRDAHLHREPWQYHGLGMKSNRINRGQMCFHCYLSFLLGLFKTEQTFFNRLSVRSRRAWKCSCSSLNCCLRAMVITARCLSIYAFFQRAVPSGCQD